MRRIVARWFLFPVAAILIASSSALAQPAPPLFVDPAPSVGAPAAAVPLGPGVRRSRVAVVDASRMDAALAAPDAGGGAPFTLNLFDDVRLTVVSDRIERDVLGHAIWVGRIADDPLGSVTLTWRAGELAGHVQTSSALYAVRTVNGRQIIEETAPLSNFVEAPARQPRSRPADPSASRPPTARPAANEEATILVMYTNAAETRAGGQSGILAAITQAVTETNTAFQSSGVTGRIRMVGAEKLTPYTEGVDIDADLDQLDTSAAVAARRTALAADMVFLILGRPAPTGPGVFVCGLAYLGPLSPIAGFGVVEQVCMFPNYSFSHEVAHNLGGNHAPEDCSVAGSDQCGGIPYARGYKDPGAPVPFRTLMAYECPTGCMRILNFSNPNVRDAINNRITGTAGQFNARAIEESFAAVAGYLGGGGGTTPAPPTGLNAVVSGTSVTLSWQTSAGATTYVLEVGVTSGSSAAFNQSVGNATTVNGTGPPGLYYWRVRAQNASGTSGPSAEGTFTLGGAVSPPGQPGALQVIVNGTSVSITWGAATGATSYRLEAGTAPNLSNAAVVQVPGTSFNTSGVPAGTYYVRVRGLNAGGPGPPTADATVVVGSACVPPSAPQNLASTVNGSLVTLNWQLSATGSAPIAYTILAGTTSNSSNLGSLPAGSGPSMQASAPPGTYFVRLVATNACGTSAPSNEVVVVVP